VQLVVTVVPEEMLVLREVFQTLLLLPEVAV
jgi:hypothetical protein